MRIRTLQPVTSAVIGPDTYSGSINILLSERDTQMLNQLLPQPARLNFSVYRSVATSTLRPFEDAYEFARILVRYLERKGDASQTFFGEFDNSYTNQPLDVSNQHSPNPAGVDRFGPSLAPPISDWGIRQADFGVRIYVPADGGELSFDVTVELLNTQGQWVPLGSLLVDAPEITEIFRDPPGAPSPVALIEVIAGGAAPPTAFWTDVVGAEQTR